MCETCERYYTRFGNLLLKTDGTSKDLCIDLEIVDKQLIASTYGDSIERVFCIGIPIEYCPFCGEKLKEIGKS